MALLPRANPGCPMMFQTLCLPLRCRQRSAVMASIQTGPWSVSPAFADQGAASASRTLWQWDHTHACSRGWGCFGRGHAFLNTSEIRAVPLQQESTCGGRSRIASELGTIFPKLFFSRKLLQWEKLLTKRWAYAWGQSNWGGMEQVLLHRKAQAGLSSLQSCWLACRAECCCSRALPAQTDWTASASNIALTPSEGREGRILSGNPPIICITMATEESCSLVLAKEGEKKMGNIPAY